MSDKDRIAALGYEATKDACWSLPPALSACTVAVPPKPHNENEPYVPLNLVNALSVIASTGSTTQMLAINVFGPGTPP